MKICGVEEKWSYATNGENRAWGDKRRRRRIPAEAREQKGKSIGWGE